MTSQENIKSNNRKERELVKTRDCYRLVSSENLEKKQDQLRVSGQSDVVGLAFKIIKKADDNREQQVEVVAMGKTIVKLIKIVEFLKKSVGGLHIAYKVGEVPFEETFEPLYEGLKVVKSVVNKAVMIAMFSFNEKLLKKEVGY